jgi:hypothetical protein
MNRHPVSFDNLVDWVDERLDGRTAAHVRAHLETGCPNCRADVIWLRRVLEATRCDIMAEPPADAVARAKELYRKRWRVRSWRLPALPRAGRWAPAMATLILLLVAVAYLSQLPMLLAGQAWVSELRGTAELRGIGDPAWQALEEGAVLVEGDLLRANEASAVLRLFDGTHLVLQPGAQVSLDTLRSGLFGASYHIALRQQAGSVEYDVASLRSTACHFEAETPTVRVSVQGTRFVITVETVEETRVTVLQGSVRLDSAEQSAVLVEREAAIVPASAPLVRLPTLTPTFTPVPMVADTLPPGLEPSPTPPATHTPTLAIRETAPPAPVAATHTAVPSVTPTASPTVAITRTRTVTRVMETSTPEALSTLGPDRIEFTGVIEAFPPYILGTWRIGGRDVLVRLTTRIQGTPAVGLQARVECLVPAPSNLGGHALVAVEIDIGEAEVSPDARPTATPWWDAVTTLLPPPVQTIVPQLPTIVPQLPTLPLPTSFTAPNLLSTMIAWPTEHPIQLPWPSRTPRPQGRTIPMEASPTSGHDINVPTATPPPESVSRP